LLRRKITGRETRRQPVDKSIFLQLANRYIDRQQQTGAALVQRRLSAISDMSLSAWSIT
jgi:hypothetical protein